MHLQALLQNQQTTVVDVRSPGEFSTGHVPGAISIPLDEIPARLTELKSRGKALVLCCASGNRSGQAERYLGHQGLSEVYNGGAWTDVEYLIENV